MVGEHLTERDGSRALQVERATRAMEELRNAASAAEPEFAAELACTSPQLRESALDLVQHLAVRRHHVRELQSNLTQLGRSSLGRRRRT